jgi:hypothetical protein
MMYMNLMYMNYIFCWFESAWIRLQPVGIHGLAQMMIGVKFRANRTDDLRFHRSRRLSTTTLLDVSTPLQVGSHCIT